jgi:hypothetical protein
MQIHESGIKIFGEDEYIHLDNIDDGWLKSRDMGEGDVFLVCGTPYRVEDDFGDGVLPVCEIKSIGLTEWVLSGNSHPKIKWHGSFATYEDGNRNNAKPVLVPYGGTTYFCHPYTGQILDSVKGECFVQGVSESYLGGLSVGLWSDIHR